MKPIALAAPAVALALLAACSPAPEPGPQPPLVSETLASAAPAPTPVLDEQPAGARAPDDATPRRRGGGAFGIGIRPTGSTATGITP
jgi:hypothetical protein